MSQLAAERGLRRQNADVQGTFARGSVVQWPEPMPLQVKLSQASQATDEPTKRAIMLSNFLSGQAVLEMQACQGCQLCQRLDCCLRNEADPELLRDQMSGFRQSACASQLILCRCKWSLPAEKAAPALLT